MYQQNHKRERGRAVSVHLLPRSSTDRRATVFKRGLFSFTRFVSVAPFIFPLHLPFPPTATHSHFVFFVPHPAALPVFLSGKLVDFFFSPRQPPPHLHAGLMYKYRNACTNKCSISLCCEELPPPHLSLRVSVCVCVSSARISLCAVAVSLLWVFFFSSQFFCL